MKRLDDNSDLLKILRCAFETYNTLKPGYLESVYEIALEHELVDAGFSVRRQVRIPVIYKGIKLKKNFFADGERTDRRSGLKPGARLAEACDMIVDDHILLELKAVAGLKPIHEKQLASYLKSTGMTEGMLLNFGNLRRLEWRVFSP